MQILVYDGTLAGLLTAIFDVYEYRYTDVTIQPEAKRQDSFFGTTHVVHTDEEKFNRVWTGLKKKLSAQAVTEFGRTFLSEQEGMENMLLQYVQYAFSSKEKMERDFSNPAVLYVTDMEKKVHREKHRMEAFVRFKQAQDGLYYATVEPDFNVLPLIATHFEKRYADQRWLIYDMRRKYGLYYDLHNTETVSIDFNEVVQKGPATVATMDEEEKLYQHLWLRYFNSVNIKARKNMKLHIQHMPKRYWKYLVEKQPL
jgi:probable DNA metabolism protein